jgi:hypothetical protein
MLPMAKIITTPDATKTLIGIDPTSADRWDDCPGKYEAVDVLHLPSLGTYSCSDTGLCTHAAIHRLNHDLLDTGTLTPATASIADTLRGFRFGSETTRSQTEAEIVPLVDQYVVWHREYGYRLVAAELDVTTTADQLPGQPGIWVYLTGRIDFLGVTQDGTLAVVDYKTGPRLLTSEEIAARLSSMIHVLLALHHLRRVTSTTVEAVEVGRLYLRAGVYTSRILSLGDIRAGRERLAGMALAVASGQFPLSPGSHCKGCPRAIECRAFNQEGSIFGID